MTSELAGRTGRGGDAGSAGLWLLVVVAVVTAATLGVLAWSGAVVARQRAESVADLAALAAARAVSGGADACAAALHVVDASGTRLAACSVTGATEVSVVVETPVPDLLDGLGLPPARARARAGPAP